jgi:hypothetical protein
VNRNELIAIERAKLIVAKTTPGFALALGSDVAPTSAAPDGDIWDNIVLTRDWALRADLVRASHDYEYIEGPSINERIACAIVARDAAEKLARLWAAVAELQMAARDVQP